MVEQLNKLYLEASNDNIHNGMSWYWNAHHICKRIAKYTRTPLYKVVGVMAALSPRNKWGRNITDTVSVVRKGYKARVCTFNNNKLKAVKILKANNSDEVYTLLNGRKVQSFYNNILKPYKDSTVTVDVWAMRSVGIDRAPTKKLYNQVEEAYQSVASSKGIKAHELQAIIWSVVRGTGAA